MDNEKLELWEIRDQISDKYHALMREKFKGVFNVTKFVNENLVLKNEYVENEELLKFKYLFQLGEEAKIYLWNCLSYMLEDLQGFTNAFNLNNNYLTQDEKEFLLKRKDTILYFNKIRNDYYWDITRLNHNKDIEVGEFILTRPIPTLDHEYNTFFKDNTLEFQRYYHTDKVADEAFPHILFSPLFFCILNKGSNEFVGTIGLSQRETNVFEIEYFIFSQYRNKKIAFKCVDKLINEALNRNLILYEETFKLDEYKSVNVEVSKIIATIEKSNLASIKLAQKLGFKFVQIVDYKLRFELTK